MLRMLQNAALFLSAATYWGLGTCKLQKLSMTAVMMTKPGGTGSWPLSIIVSSVNTFTSPNLQTDISLVLYKASCLSECPSCLHQWDLYRLHDCCANSAYGLEYMLSKLSSILCFCWGLIFLIILFSIFLQYPRLSVSSIFLSRCCFCTLLTRCGHIV